ncbi:beta-propeller domain-containing protein [Dactylosporangium sucinum]|uniref:Beta propeller domain-containing protein n=1 Tax=Dactylosporangium sucinum TaxID=1424081 RepID=A0A917UER5_9ACTN|nr:beta-propeller domain-containing protein [Dactylosporangium sucinum]GGM83803.1 hypothetical protein GCM10007977_101490 [Dactylosporangium sucinum]
MKRALAMLGALCVCISGCTADKPRPAPSPAGPQPAPALKLVAFESCDDLLAGLRAAAQEAVGPWGLGVGRGGVWLDGATGDMARAAGGAEAKAAAPGAETFSGTNTHEVGVDEPDLVKTDGKRIVTLTGGGVLKIVDVAAKRVTGELSVAGAADTNGKRAAMAANLLLSGDRVLVLGYDYGGGGIAEDVKDARAAGGPQVTLVDIAGAPKVIGRYTTDGALVDARQVGSTARVVVRSTPRLRFPDTSKLKNDEARLAANRSAIAAAPLADWLPRWDAEDATGRHTSGQVDCAAVSRPERYSGTAMLTVLSFDLAAPALGGGDPVTVVADGDTVYANGPSLYVASDQRWRVAMPMARTVARPEPPRTELFKFDISGSGKPRYVASGEVPGWLLNQYSLSEWDGYLRVATTDADDQGRQTSSTVYVLKQDGGRLAEAGHVGGLGKGERIYSVRFIATVGYVVTFRQTDPLYTLDLSSPAAPKVVGELKITGYSAYLHPAGAGRLIGVGQEASEQGRVQGTQISLFDVHDPAKPTRLARHQVPKASSEAEFDPHAFLFWPQTGLLVVPLYQQQEQGALVLRVGDATVAPVGTVRHPGQYSVIRRSLVIGGTLWTVSDAGLQANDAATLAEQGWLAL